MGDNQTKSKTTPSSKLKKVMGNYSAIFPQDVIAIHILNEAVESHELIYTGKPAICNNYNLISIFFSEENIAIN